jgi:hypothetical protein
MGLARPGERLTTRINSKNSLYPLRHFTEHLVGEFRILPQENNLDHKSSNFLIRRLKRHTGTTVGYRHLQHAEEFTGKTKGLPNWCGLQHRTAPREDKIA